MYTHISTWCICMLAHAQTFTRERKRALRSKVLNRIVFSIGLSWQLFYETLSLKTHCKSNYYSWSVAKANLYHRKFQVDFQRFHKTSIDKKLKIKTIKKETQFDGIIPSFWFLMLKKLKFGRKKKFEKINSGDKQEAAHWHNSED